MWHLYIFDNFDIFDTEDIVKIVKNVQNAVILHNVMSIVKNDSNIG